MLQSAWLFVGVVGVLATAMSLLTRDDALAMICGVAGFIGWGFFAYGSLDVRVVGDSVTYSFTMYPVTLLGIMLSLIPLYVALTGPIEMVQRARDGRMDDV